MLLDLTKDKCPITFVKTKIALEDLRKDEQLIIKICLGKDLDSMPDSLKELGYKIVQKKTIKKNVAQITIKHI